MKTRQSPHLKLGIDILFNEVYYLVEFSFSVGNAVFGGAFANILAVLLYPRLHANSEFFYHNELGLFYVYTVLAVLVFADSHPQFIG